MSDLEQFSQKISQALKLSENDITPVYRPDISELKTLSNFCLSFLSNNQSMLKSVPQICIDKCDDLGFDEEVFSATKNELETTLSGLFNSIDSDIREHGYWSFYHYLGLCTALTFHYHALVFEGKNKTTNLGDPTIWENPTFEIAVLAIHFINYQLFNVPYNKLNKFFEANNVAMEARSHFIMTEVKKLTD